MQEAHQSGGTTPGDGPKVTIGVPVYNMDTYIVAALESLLAQDYGDFEVVVSDNGSTDDTERLCRELAARDPRLRFVRQPVNRGGAANFNAVFALRHPGSRYFKWAAGDDIYEPGYLSAVVSVLDSDPTVANAHCLTDDIDEQGQYLRSWGDQGLRDDDADVAVRFADLSQRNYQCFSIFGLVRSDVLAGTRGLGYYAESDRVLLAELALRGRFVDVPEVLFHRRQHSGRSVKAYPTVRERVGWWNPDLVGRPVFPEWRLAQGYLGALQHAPLSSRDRARCYAQMGPWFATHSPHLVRNVVRTAADVGRGRVKVLGPAAR